MLHEHYEIAPNTRAVRNEALKAVRFVAVIPVTPSPAIKRTPAVVV
jgi:hypothetical protein